MLKQDQGIAFSLTCIQQKERKASKKNIRIIKVVIWHISSCFSFLMKLNKSYHGPIRPWAFYWLFCLRLWFDLCKSIIIWTFTKSFYKRIGVALNVQSYRGNAVGIIMHTRQSVLYCDDSKHLYVMHGYFTDMYSNWSKLVYYYYSTTTQTKWILASTAECIILFSLNHLCWSYLLALTKDIAYHENNPQCHWCTLLYILHLYLNHATDHIYTIWVCQWSYCDHHLVTVVALRACQ